MGEATFTSAGRLSRKARKVSTLHPVLLVGLVLISSLVHAIFVVSPHTLEWTTARFSVFAIPDGCDA